jgi:hypothetical protein
MKLRKITEEEKAINNPNATHIIDCRGLKIFLDKEEVKELVGSINNLPLQIVSNCFDEAVEYTKSNYCTGHTANIPFMPLGNVAELIELTTGKKVNWEDLK